MTALLKHTTVVGAALILVSVLTTSSARADDTIKQAPEYRKLAEVASVFAMQPVVVTCQTPQEDFLLYTAWGYVYLWAPEIHTSPYLCDAAMNVSNPAYGMSVRALAVMVLTHEAYHLRKQWSARGDEGKVQCKAIRHFRVAAMLLGATPELATQLRAYALVHHWHLAAKYPEYHFGDCKVPRA